MKEILVNNHYKILNVIMMAGEKMPLHRATSDAFIIPQSGKGKLIFKDHEETISTGGTFLIKANEFHQLEISEDFNTCIILDKDAAIKFAEG